MAPCRLGPKYKGWAGGGGTKQLHNFFDEKKQKKLKTKNSQSGERRRPLNLNLFIFYLLKKLEL
jgi:hypothetical protein